MRCTFRIINCISSVGLVDKDPLTADDGYVLDIAANMPEESAVCTSQQPIIVHLEAAFAGDEESKKNTSPLHMNYARTTSSRASSLPAITQGDVLREQFNALKAKQVNQLLKKRKLELEMVYLERKLQKEN